MGHLYEKYVWEVPVRVTHWVNMLAIITLSVTGLFIGSPKTVALTPSAFAMGWIRFIHFVAGYTFSISVLSRIYWAIVTKNRYADWREFFPIMTREGRHKMLTALKYYTFISKKVPAAPGHNALAGTAYSVVFCRRFTSCPRCPAKSFSTLTPTSATTRSSFSVFTRATSRRFSSCSRAWLESGRAWPPTFCRASPPTS